MLLSVLVMAREDADLLGFEVFKNKTSYFG